jgi:hypothetical protein
MTHSEAFVETLGTAPSPVTFGIAGIDSRLRTAVDAATRGFR